jgi:hypothetical protein
MNRSISVFVNALESIRPRNAEELRRHGFRVFRIATGVCRFVYRVNDLPLVIKFPRNSRVPPSKFGFKTLRTCIRHSQIEIEAVRRINKYVKYKPLRRYMPTIYYTDYRGGVIVMPQYDRVMRSAAIKQVSSVIKDLVADLFPNLKYPKHIFDLCSRNFGRDDNGNLIFLDLGLLECQNNN